MRLFLLLCILVPISALINWSSVESNRNVLIATSKNDGISLSTDGAVWTKTSAPSLPWNAISMSSDGKTLAATAAKYGLYISKDSGREWTKLTGLESVNWVNIKVSGSGELILACTEEGVYRSTNAGDSWEKVLDAAGNWNSITVSESGQFATAVSLEEGAYMTSDFGKTWTSVDISAETCIAVTADITGARLYTATLGEGIFTSANHGISWEKTNAPDFLVWASITSDSMGQYVVAAAADEAIYFSTNYGQSWKKSDSPSNKKWQKVMTREDGNVYAFAEGESKLFVSEDHGASWVSVTKRGRLAPENSLQSLITHSDVDLLASAVELETAVTNPPTESPTEHPSEHPSEIPTVVPTRIPTTTPTAIPTKAPTHGPTATPSTAPTYAPSVHPTLGPSAVPTVAPTTGPSVSPSRIPSAIPTAVPSVTPSVSFAPTFSPTSQNQPVVQVDTTFGFTVTSTDLTDSDLKLIDQTTFTVSNPKPDAIQDTKYTVNRRRLTRSEAKEVLLAGGTIQVTAVLVYNMVNFPDYTVDSLSTTVVASLKVAVQDTVYATTLNNLAVANGATALVGATVNYVNTEVTVDDTPTTNEDDDSLSAGEISAIVICTVFGFFVLVFVIYWYMFRTRKNDDGSFTDRFSQPAFTVAGREQKKHTKTVGPASFAMVETENRILL
jgi:hypothetical protein